MKYIILRKERKEGEIIEVSITINLRLATVRSSSYSGPSGRVLNAVSNPKNYEEI